MKEPMSLADQLKGSFEEAIAYTKAPENFKGRVRTRVLEVAPVETVKPAQVRKLRLVLKLNQGQFASLMGVSANTVSKWEQGTNAPAGSSLRLLQIIKADPKIPSNIGLLGDNVTP